jgi:hypothetical protein
MPLGALRLYIFVVFHVVDRYAHTNKVVEHYLCFLVYLKQMQSVNLYNFTNCLL